MESLSECKSSKEVGDCLKRKYDDNFISTIVDKLVGLEVGTSKCSTFMVFHSREISIKSTNWADAVSEDKYSLQET